MAQLLCDCLQLYSGAVYELWAWAKIVGAINTMVHVSLPQDLVGDGLAHVTLLARFIVQPVCLDSCDGGVTNLVHKVLQGTNNAAAKDICYVLMPILVSMVPPCCTLPAICG